MSDLRKLLGQYDKDGKRTVKRCKAWAEPHYHFHATGEFGSYDNCPIAIELEKYESEEKRKQRENTMRIWKSEIARYFKASRGERAT